MVETSTNAITMRHDLGPFFGCGKNINIENGHRSIAKLGNSYPAPPGVQHEDTILAGTNPFKPDKVEVFFQVGWLALTSLPSKLRYDVWIILTLFTPILPVGGEVEESARADFRFM